MHFTHDGDGLSLPWHGVVFVNPPYGRTLGPWVANAHHEVQEGRAQTVVALLPARPDTAYPMFGVKPPRLAAPARENALFSRPFAQGGPSSARKV